MGMENLSDLIAEIRQARDDLGGMLDTRDNRFTKRFEAIESSINNLYLKTSRPGRERVSDDADERKDAHDLCIIKHDLQQPKNDGTQPGYEPSSQEIDDALTARKAMNSLLRHGNLDRLDNLEKKSLTSFSFGSNQYILPPQWSSRILTCLTDMTDVSGLMGQEQCSGGSLKFFIDNARMADAAWACEASCFPNNPQPDLAEGLGELEIKCESLRHVICAGSDLLQDASFDIESWIFRKAATGFRNTINKAVMIGDGLGKPLGILNPQSGIPICDVSPNTTLGQFSWQDCVALKMEIPMEWQANGSFLMNARSFGLLISMSDAIGRPLFGQLPSGIAGFMLAGSPINIVTWMPDVGAGSTPIAFGDWKRTYAIVNRKATTMLTDPFSAGFCTLYKFEARIGGNTTCPNAARLMRIM